VKQPCSVRCFSRAERAVRHFTCIWLVYVLAASKSYNFCSEAVSRLIRRGLLFQEIAYRVRKYLFLFIAPIENRYEDSLQYRGKCFNQPLILGRNLEVNFQTGEYFFRNRIWGSLKVLIITEIDLTVRNLGDKGKPAAHQNALYEAPSSVGRDSSSNRGVPHPCDTLFGSTLSQTRTVSLGTSLRASALAFSKRPEFRSEKRRGPTLCWRTP